MRSSVFYSYTCCNSRRPATRTGCQNNREFQQKISNKKVPKMFDFPSDRSCFFEDQGYENEFHFAVKRLNLPSYSFLYVSNAIFLLFYFYQREGDSKLGPLPTLYMFAVSIHHIPKL